mgnify:CR=1 FL=1
MSKKKAVKFDMELLKQDNLARMEGIPKKKFSIHDINHIKPITYTQKEVFEAFFSHQNLFLYGSSGTGKTFLSLYLAFNEILHETTPQNKVIICRSTVPVRDVGFLPGSLEEKIDVYEQPYKEACDKLFKFSRSYENLKRSGYCEFIPTSFIRGITLDNAVVVVDEFQNFTFEEANSIITRCGNNTKIIFSGDANQVDLHKKYEASGLKNFKEILEKMASFSLFKFNSNDIVRSPLVKEYITVREDLGIEV